MDNVYKCAAKVLQHRQIRSRTGLHLHSERLFLGRNKAVKVMANRSSWKLQRRFDPTATKTATTILVDVFLFLVRGVERGSRQGSVVYALRRGVGGGP
jgi:hypothetical protein